jgi:phage terminase large subunit GpA-like protein
MRIAVRWMPTRKHPMLCDAHSAIVETAESFLPDPVLWVDEWSANNAYIPPEDGAEGGPYQLPRTPYAREVLRALSPDHPARRVALMVASQMMKTQTALNWIMAIIDQAPANIMAAMPSGNLADRLSGRIANTLKYTTALRGKYAEPRSRDGHNTLSIKEFNGGKLLIVSAGSSNNLAEVPVRFVYGDEVDRWERDLNKEGDPVKVIEGRQTTYGDRAKSYFTSTPTVKGFSKIAEIYESGNQQRYHVPCPHCGAFHLLEPKNLKADTDGTRVLRCWMVCP